MSRELPGYPAADMSEVFPMNWRFLPTLDPQVDIVLSRDLDSRPRCVINTQRLPVSDVRQGLDSLTYSHFGAASMVSLC